MRRSFEALLLGVALLGVGWASPLQASAEPRLRIAITPVLVESYLELNRQLVAYVGDRLGAPAEIVQRRSYKEISDLLERGEVDVGFVCGLPYVIDRERFGLELLVAPVVYDGPVYFSYVIVPNDSSVERFEQLRGRRYAFSDPLSNSGHLVPQYMLAQLGETPERFFRRSIFTYSHSASVEAVAVKFVDAASVDSYVYDYLAATQPALTARTRIIARSPAHGITPVVIRSGVDPALKARIRNVFLQMDQDPAGQAVLKSLMIKRFVTVTDDLFDSIREMRRAVNRALSVAVERGPLPR
jgi:phosphonate transport system substrate-binding protein